MTLYPPLTRRDFLHSSLCTLAAVSAAGTASVRAAESQSLIGSISKETLFRNRDGSGVTWFHPRGCMVPGANGGATFLMNLQEIGGSDYFGPVHWCESNDRGKTWTKPAPIPALDRDPVKGHPGLQAGVCDVTPQYHPQTGTVLALGHVVFYRGPRFAKGDQLARYPVYAVRDKAGQWSERKILKWDDSRGSEIYTNNCGQRFVMPNGDIMMSFTFGANKQPRMVAGVRCAFDGSDLTIREVGPPLENKVGRGLLEPSITRFGNRFFMTIRAEDLFLVYTRKDQTNANVIRWRSPLWVAQVDPEKLCLIRETEQIVLPLVGDGVNDPSQVALMGNFAVTNVSPEESCITVGEWMPRNKAKGDVLLGRIKWNKPNRNVPDFVS